MVRPTVQWNTWNPKMIHMLHNSIHTMFKYNYDYHKIRKAQSGKNWTKLNELFRVCVFNLVKTQVGDSEVLWQCDGENKCSTGRVWIMDYSEDL